MRTEKVSWRRKPIRLATEKEIMPFVKKELKKNKRFYEMLANM